MSGPFVRLLGDKGLAARYIRDAKKLLARVQDLRAQMGVPVYSLTRRSAAFTITAACFGLINVITITALPESAQAAPAESPLRGSSGIIYSHAQAPTIDVEQWIVGLAQDKERPHGRFRGINGGSGIGAGYAAAIINGTFGFATASTAEGPYPATVSVDESMATNPISTAYSWPFGFHVTAKEDGVYLAGARVLRTLPALYPFVGARLYEDGTLAVAYMDHAGTGHLCVEFLDITLLNYETTFVSHMTVDPAETAHIEVMGDRYTTVFHFHPTRREATFVSSLLGQTGTLVLGHYEKDISFTRGKMVVEGRPVASWLEVEDERLNIVYQRYKAVSLIASPSAYMVYDVPYYGSVPLRGPTSWREHCSFTATVDETLAVGYTEIPIWTGYTKEGRRLLFDVTGTAEATVSGTRTYAWDRAVQYSYDGTIWTATNSQSASDSGVPVPTNVGTSDLSIRMEDEGGGAFALVRSMPTLRKSRAGLVNESYRLFGICNGHFLTEFADPSISNVTSQSMSVVGAVSWSMSGGAPLVSSGSRVHSVVDYWFTNGTIGISLAGKTVVDTGESRGSGGWDVSNDRGVKIISAPADAPTGLAPVQRIASETFAEGVTDFGAMYPNRDHFVMGPWGFTEGLFYLPAENGTLTGTSYSQTKTYTFSASSVYNTLTTADPNIDGTAKNNRLAEGALFDEFLEKHAFCAFSIGGDFEDDFKKVFLVGDASEDITATLLEVQPPIPPGAWVAPVSPNLGANALTDDWFSPAGLI